MSRDEPLAEVVILTEPEDLSVDRFSQTSVVEKAKLFHSVLSRFTSFRDSLQKKGLLFGGRILLIGPSGTDFEAFAHHLSLEVPMKVVRLRLSAAIGDATKIANSIRTAYEFAKRNAPAVLFLEKIDALGQAGTSYATVLHSVLSESSWDNNEIIILGSTSNPDAMEPDLLAVFDRVYIVPLPKLDERVRVFEALLDGRKDIDPAIVGELTEGWGFSDLKHLAVNLMTDVPISTDSIPRVKLEQLLENIGAEGLGRYETRARISRIARGSFIPEYEFTQSGYPEEFLDQLYLMAVGDDFQGTQRIIEALNNNMPLTQQDRDFLSNYPFILTGTPEDRLTRLMKAKRTNDRLSRIMGR
ncbi:MAG: AAA family ATPase [Candidatus Thorarchaeota archaeon]